VAECEVLGKLPAHAVAEQDGTLGADRVDDGEDLVVDPAQRPCAVAAWGVAVAAQIEGCGPNLVEV
jgi:hypothetical protein